MIFQIFFDEIFFTNTPTPLQGVYVFVLLVGGVWYKVDGMNMAHINGTHQWQKYIEIEKCIFESTSYRKEAFNPGAGNHVTGVWKVGRRCVVIRIQLHLRKGFTMQKQIRWSDFCRRKVSLRCRFQGKVLHSPPGEWSI